MRTFITLLSVIAHLMTGCDDSGLSTPFSVETKGSEIHLEHEPVEIPPTGAHTKRLSIDMLEDSLSLGLLAGDNVDWSVSYLGKTYRAFDILGPTLGRPDYVSLTEENLEPTPLYLKFMGDMAITVCDQMVANDKKKGSARELMRFISESDPEAGVDANLRYLKLRYFAIRVADDDTAGVADLRTVYDVALEEAGNNKDAIFKAWKAVCVALLTAPQFHLY